MVKLLTDFSITNDTPYIALTGELWGVFLEFFNEYRPRYIESVVVITDDEQFLVFLEKTY